ncbi:MAG: hypothetical protein Q8R89_03965, partial [Desulfomicrobium sp.]|nr:hypothetical protein [Desulfomicrobium sp.]
MDFFSIGLTLACVSAAGGALWRVRTWFLRGKAFAKAGDTGPGVFRRFVGGLADVILLRRTLRDGPARWTGHMLLVLGFLPLIFLHAMDDVVTRPLFSAYEPT